MKCPNRDEWVPYVLGEATPDPRKRFRAHLESCPDCGAEVAGWKRSLEKLDRWKLPAPQARMEAAQPILRLALAALVMLGLGLGLGRLLMPAGPSPARVEAAVKASLAAELFEALARVQVQSSNAIASAELRWAKASEAEMGRLAQGLIEAMDSARQEDRRTIQVLFETLQQQHEAELISVRTDLETVASLTDNEIRHAQLKLTQIAAGNPSTP